MPLILDLLVLLIRECGQRISTLNYQRIFLLITEHDGVYKDTRQLRILNELLAANVSPLIEVLQVRQKASSDNQGLRTKLQRAQDVINTNKKLAFTDPAYSRELHSCQAFVRARLA